ncbi:hypothetical protein HUJ04_011009 [Dendroctonus ponderosae]|nr:hypothetical protein HUJ04_011009 [Dendroctonus ponderosae]
MPSYRDYWSSRPELRDPLISSAMVRDGFSWILANIHLNDNSVQPGRDSPNYDKLYKLRPLLDILSETYKNSWKPSKNQSIDESMIRFKGRNALKQYMPNKPIKRGYKWSRKSSMLLLGQLNISVLNYMAERIGLKEDLAELIKAVRPQLSNEAYNCDDGTPEGKERNSNCALCGTAGHPASWRGCPKYPRKTIPVVRKETIKQLKPAAAHQLDTLDQQELAGILRAILDKLHG